MIKRKGVCDICNTEFELDEGTFATRIAKDSARKWTITVSSCGADGCIEEGSSHVCGMACLYEAISEVIDKKTRELDFKIVGYNGSDDSTALVLDLRDKKTK
jgi:hypothetical protein